MRGVKSRAFIVTTTLLSLWLGNVSADNEYMVEKGDSLYKIGKLLGVPWKEIMKANNLKSTVIHPDQILIIPAAGKFYTNQISNESAVVAKTGSPATVSNEVAPKEPLVATLVDPTLVATAKPAQVPVPQPPPAEVEATAAAQSVDGVDQSTVAFQSSRSYSDAVYIPPIQGNSRARDKSPKPPKTYMVRNGDTIWSISRQFGLTLRELQTANNMRHSKIYPGQLLSIPDKLTVASN